MSMNGGGQGKPDTSFPDAPSMSISADTDAFARIKRPAFVASLFTLLAIATIAAASRTFLRVKRFRTLAWDDAFLILAVVFMATSTAVVFISRDFTYTQLNVSTARVMPPDNFPWQMVQFETLDNVSTATVWAAIFSVKFSFVMFFRNLIARVRGMKALWWTVVGVLCAAAPTNMFLGFYICTNFTENLLAVCTNKGMVSREGTYLIVTVVLDIFTDLLIISTPVALLWRVKLSLKRKLALLTVLGLSAFMIVIAIIRVTLSTVTSPALQHMPATATGGAPRVVPDSIWLFFWQQMEACIAVLMVSLTAFRSMLGQQSPRSKKGHYGGSSSGASGFKSEKHSSFFGKFRHSKSTTSSDHSGGNPNISAPVPGTFQTDGFDRSMISYPVTLPGKVVPVAMTRLDHGPPPPPKSPRWHGQIPRQQMQHKARSDSDGSEEIELQGRRPARSDSFV